MLDQLRKDALKAGYRAHESLFRQRCAEVATVVPHPTFIKVGANDGFSHDIAAKIVASGPWRGLLIEPGPRHYRKLLAHYGGDDRFIVVQAGIGAQAGEATLWHVAPEAWERYPALPASLDGIASLDREHVVRHVTKERIRVAFPGVEGFVAGTPIALRPLHAVAAEHGVCDPTLLQIDTEGHDWQVLQSAGSLAPLMIYVEHEHVPEDDKGAMLDWLLDRGYRVYDCGSDWFGVHDGRWAALKL